MFPAIRGIADKERPSSAPTTTTQKLPAVNCFSSSSSTNIAQLPHAAEAEQNTPPPPETLPIIIPSSIDASSSTKITEYPGVLFKNTGSYPTLAEYHSFLEPLLNNALLDNILLIAEDTLSQAKVLHRHIKDSVMAATLQADHLSSPTQIEASWGLQGICWDIINTNAIIYVGNGKIAYEVFNLLPNTIPTLLLTDQQMPLMSGTELINAIMESEKAPPAAIAIHSAVSSGKDDPAILQCLQRWSPTEEKDGPDGSSPKKIAISFITKKDTAAIASFIKQLCCESPSPQTSKEDNSDTEKANNPAMSY